MTTVSVLVGRGSSSDMSEEPRTPDSPIVVAEPSQPSPVVIQSSEPSRRSFSFGSFVIGFIAALIVAAIAAGVFLAVSDSDDDGNIQLDVPAVDVEVDG